MKVGDYVRTPFGIWQLEFIRTQAKKYTHHLIKQYYGFTIFRNVEKKRIKKSSSNIIDLIEVGDYVNGVEVIGFEKDNDNKEYLQCGVGDYVVCTYYAESIKSIVTKEQFEEMEYKI